MIRTRSSEKDNIMYCCKDCSDRMKATWQSMNKKTKINVGDYVKVCVKEGRKKEHMWFEIVECSSSGTFIL